MVHQVFIDLDYLLARNATAGTDLPRVSLKLRTDETVAFAFMSRGFTQAVTGFANGKVVVKQSPTSAVLLLDTTLETSGSGSATVYEAVWTADQMDGPDGGALRTYMASVCTPPRLERDAWMEIQWTDDNGQHSVYFAITLVPTFNDPADEAPDPNAVQADAYVAARAVCYDRAQTLTEAQAWQALGNLGVTFVNGTLRFVMPDGSVAYAALIAGEPPTP